MSDTECVVIYGSSDEESNDNQGTEVTVSVGVGNAIDDSLLTLLKSKFNKDEFRPQQLEAIRATIERADCFVVLPTGSGKSLCYQLPAVYENMLTIVISPLISLMRDQVRKLKELQIEADILCGLEYTEAYTLLERVPTELAELTDAHRDRRMDTCRALLSRQLWKSFLWKIVTGDEKWIYTTTTLNAESSG